MATTIPTVQNASITSTMTPWTLKIVCRLDVAVTAFDSCPVRLTISDSVAARRRRTPIQIGSHARRLVGSLGPKLHASPLRFDVVRSRVPPRRLAFRIAA